MTYLIRQMGHVTFGTPDPERSAVDLVDLVGLRVSGWRDGTALLTSNERLYEVAFRKSTETCVAAVGLEAMDAAAVDEVHRRAVSDGLEVIADQPLGPGIERAVRFRAPFGLVIEVHTPVKRSEVAHYVGPGSHPRRIEHINLKVPDVLAMRDVFTSVLGLKLSDARRVTSSTGFALMTAIITRWRCSAASLPCTTMRLTSTLSRIWRGSPTVSCSRIGRCCGDRGGMAPVAISSSITLIPTIVWSKCRSEWIALTMMRCIRRATGR
jgi:catechol 2,3-dioxygenase-like lactoylglutathione lyase family enzyme